MTMESEKYTQKEAIIKYITDSFEKYEDISTIGANVEFSENALKILKERYFCKRLRVKYKYNEPDINVRYIEDTELYIEELFGRVARIVASAESLYINKVCEYLDENPLAWIKTIEKNIYADLMNKRFIFNTPALYNAGAELVMDKNFVDLVYCPIEEMTIDKYKTLINNKKIRQQLQACFVIGIDDDLNSIYDSIKDAALISKYGGGVGLSYGKLREKGAIISRDGGHSTGPISFMNNMNSMAGTVVQGGKRRAALMSILPIDHPDIEEFITVKDDKNVLNNTNLSVSITDDFIEAVKNNSNWNFYSRKDHSIAKTVKAKDLWDLICEHAWKSGEPGVVFQTTIDIDNSLEALSEWKITGTNPCGEQPLYDNVSCNLGSINLMGIDLEYSKQVTRAIYYLDLVLDATHYPLEKIENRVMKIRPVGLGLMGLADYFINKVSCRYGSSVSFEYTKNLFGLMGVESLKTSYCLAHLKEPYPMNIELTTMNKRVLDMLDPEGPDMVNEKALVNAIAERSNLHDNYPFTYFNTLYYYYIEKGKNDNNYYDNDTEIGKLIMAEILFNPVLRNIRRISQAPTGTTSMIFDASAGVEPNFEWAWVRTINAANGDKIERIYKHILLSDEYFEEYKQTGKISNVNYVKASDLTPEEHLSIVEAGALFCDSGISKTVNLPEDATVEDVKKIYELAHKIKTKGITVYRDGCRKGQPIQSIVEKKPEPEKVKEAPKIITKYLPIRPKNHPGLIDGITVKENTPWGSIYVTLNYDINGPFELFINLGKSGSELKAMVEALARVISIYLRGSNGNLRVIIKTLQNLSGKESWFLKDQNDDEPVWSIPDIISRVLSKALDAIESKTDFVSEIENESVSEQTVEIKKDKVEESPVIKTRDYGKLVCPQCSSPMEIASGCAICMSCGFSPCGH
jgi:ribonucleoside-diphosphate reductase alpha chain